MEICGECVDDILIKLYQSLISDGSRNETGTRGRTTELLGATLRLSNPRSRISRSESRGKIFSAIGELFWYLSGSDKLAPIKPYVPKYEEDAVNGVLQGAYGPRFISMRGSVNQFESVIKILKERPGTRRAIIQIFNAEDIATTKKEIPCTTTLQFHLRNNELGMSVTMRSNDAYFGLPHDVFCFTMIQEMVSKALGVELGVYIHHVGSIHVYDEHVQSIKNYISEGYQRIGPMPKMPDGNPFDLFKTMLKLEDQMRHGEMVRPFDPDLNGYWSDILLLLESFWCSGNVEKLEELKDELAYSSYMDFIENLKGKKIKTPQIRTVEVEV